MSDLVEQLRHHAFDRSNSYRSLTLEAAKALADAQREIERLRGLLDNLRAESAIIFQDDRLSYVEIQVTRSVWQELLDYIKPELCSEEER